MKLTISILFCIILTSQYNSADGQLKNFFGRVHETVQGSANKVTQDVRTLFNPNTNNKQEENKDASTNIHFIEEVSKEDVGAGQTAKKVEVTPQPTTSTTTPAQNAPKNGTTGQGEDKDGRENFAGGCVTGFMRTADGRCKPTF